MTIREAGSAGVSPALRLAGTPGTLRVPGSRLVCFVLLRRITDETIGDTVRPSRGPRAGQARRALGRHLAAADRPSVVSSATGMKTTDRLTATPEILRALARTRTLELRAWRAWRLIRRWGWPEVPAY